MRPEAGVCDHTLGLWPLPYLHQPCCRISNLVPSVAVFVCDVPVHLGLMFVRICNLCPCVWGCYVACVIALLRSYICGVCAIWSITGSTRRI